MISYYIAGPAWATRSWKPRGVFAVDSDNPMYYTNYQNWPIITVGVKAEFGDSLKWTLDNGWWVPMIDEDLIVDEGL